MAYQSGLGRAVRAAIVGGMGVACAAFALSVDAQTTTPVRPAAASVNAGTDGGAPKGASSAAVRLTPVGGGITRDGGAPASASPDGGTRAAPTAVASASTASTVAPTVPTFRPHSPPLPPPSPDQIAAYDAMRQETDAYERGARDYKDTITTIVTLHYEEKKKAILGGLDREIGIEKEELKKARETAIRRLEDFVARYSGPNAQPDATPDAMYRLAALYEERARSDDDPSADLAVTLKPAIALYKRVIRDFPSYVELAGIYYFLGHALTDSRRVDEGQQVWRSLVCPNHYKYPVASDPKSPDVDKITPMPQDHEEAYWKTWRSKYPRAESLKKGPKDETTFTDPYLQDCQPVAQPNILPGQEPKYVAEIWWRIGDWEFDQNDVAGGV
ncbi:MAG TPA: hypothetical protein VKU41_27970, partial [Polyangiaceae bacterium]|nr:hypothetical protein [Polyangiaceae bacterium]